ncbi:MAG TPA: DUF3500 domain-containing protein [Vicinamibacterales bacterium]|nr:DUF3500 domain-containing protein [Vicinamibacterales bacterium]
MRTIRSPRFLIWLACVLALAATYAADRSPANMANAATKYLATLSAEQREAVSFPFADTEQREHFGFVPTEMFSRKGLTMGAMNEAQRQAAHDLMRSGLSQKGYATAAAIMELEALLNEIENPVGAPARQRPLARDPLKYYVSVFGTPGNKSTWGWRVEGHHLSLNFTVVNGRMVSTTPHFFGSNPAEVRTGPKKGLRILGYEEDPARELVMALNATQRTKAVINTTAPKDILTHNDVNIQPLEPTGIAITDLQPKQRETLMRVIDAYTSVMAPDLAADRMAALKAAGLDKISFAWSGELEAGKKHYYRVQGPTFLIEFDNTQNDGNHVHSVWRDFNGDFGRDLLREHVSSVAH